MSAQTPGRPGLVRASDAGVPTQRRGMKGTARDMILSMAVILAIVVGFVALVARPNEVVQPAIDLPNAVSGATDQLGYAPSTPDPIPSGWTPINARVQNGEDGIRTWHVTFKTPDGRYAAIHQAENATDKWENTQVTDGEQSGVHRVAGQDWTVRSRTDRGITSFVLHQGEWTTVVTGTTDAANLDTLITALSAPTPAPTATATSS